jgi:PAS domain S-box-containing protein
MATKPAQKLLAQKVAQQQRQIAELTKTQQTLWDSLKKYHVIVESSPDAVAVAKNGEIQFVNAAFTQLLGFNQDDIDSRLNFFDLIHEFDRDAVYRQFKLNADEIQWRANYRTDLTTRKGNRVSCEISVSRIDEAGQPAELLIIRALSEDRYLGDDEYKVPENLEMRVGEPTAAFTANSPSPQVDAQNQESSQAASALREKELLLKIQKLEDANAVMKGLLKRISEDKSALEDKVMASIQELVYPHLENLKKKLPDDQLRDYVDILDSNLKEIIAHLSDKVSTTYSNLTPTEIRVANLIKQGENTAEIAARLNLSPEAVETSRDNIREKFGIKNDKTDLKEYLLSLEKNVT